MYSASPQHPELAEMRNLVSSLRCVADLQRDLDVQVTFKRDPDVQTRDLRDLERDQARPKQKPNEACYCGSGRKYKKCHGLVKAANLR